MSQKIQTPKKRLRQPTPKQLISGELPKTPSSIKQEGYNLVPSQPLMQAPFMSNKARNLSPRKKTSESPRKRVLLTCTPDQDYLLSPGKKNAMSISPVRPLKSTSAEETKKTSPITDDRAMEMSPVRKSTSHTQNISPSRGRERGQYERPRVSASMSIGGNQSIFSAHAPLQPTYAPKAATSTKGNESEPLFLPSDSDDEDLENGG